MSQPLISICCLAFNHEPYIRECLEGFIMQKTNFEYEVLIHDDASTDNTATIIREYEAKYPDIIKPIYQTENQYSKGIGVTRVFQFPRAKGKYIAMCEGDDYWTYPYKLQKQVDFLEANLDYSMCFHNATVEYVNDSKKSHSFKELENREYTGKDILNDWIVPTASVLFRVCMLDIKRNINKNFLYGDLVLFLSLAEKGRIFGMSEIMCVYRKHEGGLTAKQDSLDFLYAYLKHNIEIHNTYKQFTNKKFKQIISMIYIRISWRQFKNYSFSFIINILYGMKWSPYGFFGNIITHFRKS